MDSQPEHELIKVNIGLRLVDIMYSGEDCSGDYVSTAMKR
jgi:hypothetical protein